MNIVMGRGVLQPGTHLAMLLSSSMYSSALKNEEVITSEILSIYQTMFRQIPYRLNGHVFHSGEVQSN